MAPPAGNPLESIDEQGWPDSLGQGLLFLLEITGQRERDVPANWISENDPGGRSGRAAVSGLEARLAVNDDPLLAPLRVAWLPRENEERRPSIRRFLVSILFGDPYEPGRLRQWSIARFRPELCRVLYRRGYGENVHYDRERATRRAEALNPCCPTPVSRVASVVHETPASGVSGLSRVAI